MKIRSFFALSLLTALLLVGCAPADASAPVQTEAPLQPPPAPKTDEPQAPPPTETEAPPVVTEAPPTQASAAEPLPIATSRGNSLEATDPGTFTPASGELQLVEFFAYW